MQFNEIVKFSDNSMEVAESVDRDAPFSESVMDDDIKETEAKELERRFLKCGIEERN